MTLEGLRTIMNGFDIIEDGVQPYQMPSYAWRMQIESALPHLRVGKWKSRLEELLEELRSSGDEFDRDLGPIGQRVLAAGVFTLARRPKM